MNIVYVLVSNSGDLYYNQLLLSLLSLRNVMKRVTVTVLTDQDTYDSLTGNRSEVFELADYIKRIEIHGMTNKEKSRYLKVNMRRFLSGDFMYIDTDTIICDDLSNIQTYNNFACVVDKNCLLNDNTQGSEIVKRAKRFGYAPAVEAKHFNSGVMWVPDDAKTRVFFNDWYKLWDETRKQGYVMDQLSLNQANALNNGMIQELPGEWNCQISHTTQGLQYLYRAKIIHYFASYSNGSVPYDLANAEIQKKVVDKRYRNEISIMLSHPKENFKCVKLIGNDVNEAKLTESEQFRIFLSRNQKKGYLYQIVEWVLYKIRRFKEKILYR